MSVICKRVDCLKMKKSGHAFHPEDTALIEQYLIEELKHYSIETE